MSLDLQQVLPQVEHLGQEAARRAAEASVRLPRLAQALLDAARLEPSELERRLAPAPSTAHPTPPNHHSIHTQYPLPRPPPQPKTPAGQPHLRRPPPPGQRTSRSTPDSRCRLTHPGCASWPPTARRSTRIGMPPPSSIWSTSAVSTCCRAVGGRRRSPPAPTCISTRMTYTTRAAFRSTPI